MLGVVDMSFYWAIKWKSYSVEDLLVNGNQKEYIENEWIKDPDDRKSPTFKLNGELYSYSSIDSITRTSKPIVDETKLLYASEASARSKAPMMNADGDVITNWYKKLVSTKGYDSYYGKHPSYYFVGKEDSGIWVGFRLAEKENGERADTVEQCTEGETEKLWMKYQKTASS
jgi:hypothetical protein